MILYSSSQKHSISRAAFAKVAGIGTEVALHVPFEVSVERRRVEVVEEAHGDDAAFTPRHSMQPLKKSCTYWQQSSPSSYRRLFRLKIRVVRHWVENTCKPDCRHSLPACRDSYDTDVPIVRRFQLPIVTTNTSRSRDDHGIIPKPQEFFRRKPSAFNNPNRCQRI